MTVKTIGSHIIQRLTPPGLLENEKELGAQVLSEEINVADTASHVHSVPLRFSRHHIVPIFLTVTLADGSRYIEKFNIFIFMGEATPVFLGRTPPEFTLRSGLIPYMSNATFRTTTFTLYSDLLTDSSPSQTIDFESLLPSDAIVVCSETYLAEAFSGGSVATAVARVGTASDPTCLVNDRNIFTGASLVYESADGNRPTGTYGPAQFQVTVTVTGGNVVDLDTGWFYVNVHYMSAESETQPIDTNFNWDSENNALTVTVTNNSGGLANISVTSSMESWVQPIVPE